MLGPIGHVASYVAFLARKGARSAADHDAARELARDAIAPGVELRWLGTAGFALRAEGTTILIDPYVTRVPLGALIRRRAIPPDERAIARWIDAADAILVGHTHFDHALDTPAIAARFGCKAYGSSSLAQLMARIHGHIKANPGQGVVPMATSLGISNKDLRMPIRKLVEENKVRSTGKTRGTRYFPR